VGHKSVTITLNTTVLLTVNTFATNPSLYDLALLESSVYTLRLGPESKVNTSGSGVLF
jgi:hypothetical protein